MPAPGSPTAPTWDSDKRLELRRGTETEHAGLGIDSTLEISVHQGGDWNTFAEWRKEIASS